MALSYGRTLPRLGQVHGSNALLRAVDTDFGVSGLQAQSWFDALPGLGFSGFATTLHTFWSGVPTPWADANTALTRALNAGLWIGAYGRPVDYWRQALNNITPDVRSQLKFFALDVEPEDDNGLHKLRQDQINGVEDMGVRPIIYTTYVQWPAIMDVIERKNFGSYPLWDYAGLYNGDGVGWPTSMTEAPFNTTYANGWNTTKIRTGWQLNTEAPATINGVVCDHNVFDSVFIDGK